MKKRTRTVSTPEITPLIDVVFLLLIFFMVSTVFKRDELALLLTLPTSAFGQAQDTSPPSDLITLELGTTDIAFNGTKTTLNSIDQYLENIVKKETPVDVRIDRLVRYDRIIKLFDKLKQYQLSNISLITEHQDQVNSANP